jgi:hypothetical protein
MGFDLKAEAQGQVREERKRELVKKYRDTRSQLVQAKKEAENAARKVEGLTGALAKIEKEAEDELGEEWQ